MAVTGSTSHYHLRNSPCVAHTGLRYVKEWLLHKAPMSNLPPKAVPFQVRPVTSWNGRVEISCPAAATPMMVDTPQPLWQLSRAARCENGIQNTMLTVTLIQVHIVQ